MSDQIVLGSSIDERSNLPQLYKDMGDGTYARVINVVTGGSSGLIRYGQDRRGLAIKYKDMGDGTYAETVVGG